MKVEWHSFEKDPWPKLRRPLWLWAKWWGDVVPIGLEGFDEWDGHNEDVGYVDLDYEATPTHWAYIEMPEPPEEEA